MVHSVPFLSASRRHLSLILLSLLPRSPDTREHHVVTMNNINDDKKGDNNVDLSAFPGCANAPTVEFMDFQLPAFEYDGFGSLSLCSVGMELC
jgi:hypothetical protein